MLILDPDGKISGALRYVCAHHSLSLCVCIIRKLSIKHVPSADTMSSSCIVLVRFPCLPSKIHVLNTCNIFDDVITRPPTVKRTQALMAWTFPPKYAQRSSSP